MDHNNRTPPLTFRKSFAKTPATDQFAGPGTKSTRHVFFFVSFVPICCGTSMATSQQELAMPSSVKVVVVVVPLEGNLGGSQG